MYKPPGKGTPASVATIIFTLCVLLLFGMFLFLSTTEEVEASGTTYYVDGDVASSGDGSSWAQAFKTIGEGENAAIQAGDTVEISGGTYNEYVIVNANSGSAGNPIIFKGSETSGHNDEVIIDRDGQDSNCLYVNQDYIYFQNITIKNADTGRYNIYITGNNITLDNIRSEDGYIQLVIETGTGLLIKNSQFKGSEIGSIDYGYKFLSNTTGNIEYSIFKASNNNPGAKLGFWDGSNFNIYNSVITNSYDDGIVVKSGATVNIKNSILVGNQESDKYEYTINCLGTCNLSNSLWLPSGLRAELYGLNGVTESNNINQIPKFVSPRRSGIFSFTIDDYDLDYAEEMADVLEPYGFYLTFFVPSSFSNMENYQSRLQALVNAGHEIGGHSYSHPQLTNTNAFEIQYTGAGATSAMTVSSNQLTIDCSDDNDDVGPLDFTSSNYDTLGELCTFLNGLSNYTCTRNSSTSSITLSTGLADISSQDIKTAAYTAQLDQTRFFHDELTEAKALIESVIGNGYECKSFAYPFNDQDETVRDAVKNAGFIGARGPDNTPKDFQLENFEIFSAHTLEYLKGDGTEAEIKKNTAAACSALQENGGFGAFLSHTANEYTIEQIGWIAETLSQCSNVEVMTFGDAMDHIRTSGNWTDADGDGERWTRTFTDRSDYHLQSTSSLIDAGTDLSLTTDFGGNLIYGTPDIGGYEYQPPYTIGTDNVDITSPIRIYSDGKYRYTGTTSGGTQANFSTSPSDGWPSDDYSQWMDVDINTWNTFGTYYKKWTESASGTLSVDHTVGDLKANTYYTVKVDGTRYNTYLSNSSGEISFTYTGEYSGHEFEVEEDTTSPASFTLSSPANDSSTSEEKPILSWNASSDSESGLAKYQLYIDGSLDRDNIDATTTSTTPANDLACGDHTWFIRAYDNAGNYTDSSTHNLTRTCGGGGLPPGAYNPPTPPAPSPENPEGGFKVLINDNKLYTESRKVTLTLFAGNDTKRMTISRDPDFAPEANTGQISYQNSYTWDLCYRQKKCPSGAYIVYVKFYTQWGRASEIVSGSIVLTSTEPEVSIEEMTKEEIKAKILEIQQQIIKLLTQLIQLIQQEIAQIQA